MSNPEVYQLFVYGSLRSGFRSPAYEYISRYFTFISNGRVRGKLYDLTEYSAGVPTEEDCFITGELYMIRNQNEFSWAIGQLDDYEGIAGETVETSLFRRDLVDVLINDQVARSWIYWFNGNVSGYPVISSGDLLEYLKRKNK